MAFNLWYTIHSFDRSDRAAIEDAARDLAPSSATLTTLLLDDAGTGEIAYAMRGTWLDVDDEELYSRLEGLCDFDKTDDDDTDREDRDDVEDR